MLPMILGLSLSGLVIMALSPSEKKDKPAAPDKEIVIIRTVKTASWSDRS